jgi:hypothetical protein
MINVVSDEIEDGRGNGGIEPTSGRVMKPPVSTTK